VGRFCKPQPLPAPSLSPAPPPNQRRPRPMTTSPSLRDWMPGTAWPALRATASST